MSQIKKIVWTSQIGPHLYKGCGDFVHELITNLKKHLDINLIVYDYYEYPESITSYNVTVVPVFGCYANRKKQPPFRRALGKILHNIKKRFHDMYEVPKLVYSIIDYKAKKTINKEINENTIIVMETPFVYFLLSKHKRNFTIYYPYDIEYHRYEYNERFYLRAFFLKYFIRYIEKIVCKRADLIITLTEDLKKRLIAIYKVPEEKIMVVPLGIDFSKYHPLPIDEKIKLKRELNIGARIIVLFVGGAHAPHRIALETIYRLATKFPNVYFLVVGSAGMLIQNKKLPANMICTGVVSDEQLIKFFQVADIGINPTDWPGILKTIHYLVMGLPVLTTNETLKYSILPNIEHYNCLIAKPLSDLSEFENGLRELINNDKLRFELSKNGLQYAKMYFNIEVTTKKMVDIILERYSLYLTQRNEK